MPDTAVGMANGRSTIASTNFLPRKRISHQRPGDDQPEDALIVAATSDAPNDELVGADDAGIGDGRPELAPN